jgi:adenosylcobyric acid synthase
MTNPASETIDIAVIRFPRIANFDDFDPLRDEPNTQLRYVESAADFGYPTLVILPGTRATVADLNWLRAQHLDAAIHRHLAAGGHVFGICGGLQMLGTHIVDPDGIESAPGSIVKGLSLLPLETHFIAERTAQQASGTLTAGLGIWAAAAGLAVIGYEIHMGKSTTRAAPFIEFDGRADGAVSSDGRVAGTYLHGLFHNDLVRAELLAALGKTQPASVPSFAQVREREFNRLASVVQQHLSLAQLRSLHWPAGQ